MDKSYEKKTIRFGNSDAIIINDLSLKNKIIDFIFDSVELSNYRYNMLNNLQRLKFLKENEHYVTPNFMGINYFVAFMTIDKTKYCIAIDKRKMSYHKSQTNIKKVTIYKIMINASHSVFRGTIFDCKLINSQRMINNRKVYNYDMLIKDCYFLMGNKVIDIEMGAKIKHIDNVIKTQFSQNKNRNFNFNFKINKFCKYTDLKDLVENIIPKCSIRSQGLVFYPKYSGINIIYIDKKQNRVGITSTNISEGKIESKSYDLLINLTEYLKARSYSYETEGKTKRFWLKNTEIPDVYNLFESIDDDKLGIAHIPNLKISHMCNEIVKEEPVQFTCRYDKDYKKWIPIHTC